MASNASQGASEHSFDVLSAVASNASQGATEHSFEDDFEVISQDLPASSDGYPSAAAAHGLGPGAKEHTTASPIETTGASSSGYGAEGASEHLTVLSRRHTRSNPFYAGGLLSRTEAEGYKKGGGTHGRKAARRVLDKVIEGKRSVEFLADGTSFYLDTKNSASEHIGIWSEWKTYISNIAEDVVGDTGIARLTCEFIQHTTDPNRGEDPRCDFIVYHGNGSFWRLHPGNKGKDATPKYFPTALCQQVLESTEPVEWDAAGLWRRDVPHTGELMCRSVPQVDRVGKKEVWKWVTSLGALEHAHHEFDIGGDAGFQWWLWLPTLFSSGHIAMSGIDIVRCRIQTDATSYARFAFVASDGGIQEIVLKARNGILHVARGA